MQLSSMIIKRDLHLRSLGFLVMFLGKIQEYTQTNL